jgi:UDP-N-acetylglucosamine--N-acetylmuramyl-(pentapeptide) pyrophosphoryl-undecaprenol N-acetylglucosamine transferase
MKPDHPPHVVFTGGGTGGHLFPGLAVAERLVADWPRARITFAGSGKPWQRHVVAAAGFDYVQVDCRPFPRRLREVLPFLAHNVAGYRAAVRYLGWHRVAVVVGLGGYTSVPMARAAVRSKIPLLLLEQNVVPGRATRWLAPSAEMVCAAFEQTVAELGAKCTVRVTGNPVREAFLARPMAAVHGPHDHCPVALTPAADESAGSPAGKQLLILGGSGGARSLNQHVPHVLHVMGRRLAGWKIVHQSGESEFEATRRLYAASGLLHQQAEVRAFLTDMPQVLGRSDLAICRAGGTTLAELAAAGVPAVLLPYPFATDDHQRRNAEVFTATGGALLLDERELGSKLRPRLAAAVARLLVDDAGRARMSQAIRRRAYPDATWDVATMIRHLA